MTVAMILLVWIVVSIPVAIVVGKLFAFQDIDSDVHEMSYKVEDVSWQRRIVAL